MKSIGIRDKTYYYSNKIVLGVELTFDRNIEIEKFAKAFKKLLIKHSYLNVRPVFKNGKLYYQANNNPVPLVKYEQLNGIKVGTDQTNGYPFVFSLEGNKLTMLMAHGVSDYLGLTVILDSLVCYIAIEYGIKEGSNKLYNLEFISKEDSFDPYKIYGNKKAKPIKIEEIDGPTILPKANINEKCHSVEFFFNTDEYLKYMKENEASFVPLLIDIISTALEKKDGNENAHAVASITGNIRNLFNSKCLTNFNETAQIPSLGINSNLSVKEKAANYKKVLKQQLDVENVQYLINKKVKQIKDIESGKEIKTDNERRIPSYVLSYVGKEHYTNDLEGFIKSYNIFPALPFSPSIFAIIVAKDEGVLLQLHLSGDVKQYAKCIADELNLRGISTSEIKEMSFPVTTLDIKEFKCI